MQEPQQAEFPARDPYDIIVQQAAAHERGMSPVRAKADSRTQSSPSRPPLASAAQTPDPRLPTDNVGPLLSPDFYPPAPHGFYKKASAVPPTPPLPVPRPRTAVPRPTPAPAAPPAPPPVQTSSAGRWQSEYKFQFAYFVAPAEVCGPGQVPTAPLPQPVKDRNEITAPSTADDKALEDRIALLESLVQQQAALIELQRTHLAAPQSPNVAPVERSNPPHQDNAGWQPRPQAQALPSYATEPQQPPQESGGPPARAASNPPDGTPTRVSHRQRPARGRGAPVLHARKPSAPTGLGKKGKKKAVLGDDVPSTRMESPLNRWGGRGEEKPSPSVRGRNVSGAARPWVKRRPPTRYGQKSIAEQRSQDIRDFVGAQEDEYLFSEQPPAEETSPVEEEEPVDWRLLRHEPRPRAPPWTPTRKDAGTVVSLVSAEPFNPTPLTPGGLSKAPRDYRNLPVSLTSAIPAAGIAARASDHVDALLHPD